MPVDPGCVRDSLIYQAFHPWGEWAVRYPGAQRVTFYFATLDEACTWLIRHPARSGDVGVTFRAKL